MGQRPTLPMLCPETEFRESKSPRPVVSGTSEAAAWLVASAFCFGEVGAFLHVDLWPLRLQMYITHREDRIRQVENVRTPSLSHCGSHAYYRAWVLSAKLPIQQRSCEQWTSAWTWLTSSSGCTRLTSHELRDLAASPTFHYTRHSRKCCSRRGCSGICR